MKVLSDILHKAGILKEGAETYSSGGYSVVVRNATTQRFETVASTAFANIYTENGSLLSNRTVTMGNFTLSFEKDILVNGLNIGRGGGNLNSNTSFGISSLASNTTGVANTAIGPNTLGLNTTGIFNTAIGRLSLYNTNASNNTSIGASSLFANTSGSSNSAIGSLALLNNTTGSNNTAIGYYAGAVPGTTNTTGSNNIFIGANSIGVSATESNRTWIGNSLTTSTWLAGNVLIGTTTDAGLKLDVNGFFRMGPSAGHYLSLGTDYVLRSLVSNTLIVQDSENISMTANNTGSITLSTQITPRLVVNNNGTLTASSLAGTGSRMVVADSSGVLSTSALPTSYITHTQIYISLGVVLDNREQEMLL
jgi:hypothetical protein